MGNERIQAMSEERGSAQPSVNGADRIQPQGTDRMLYLQAESGISGDMFVAALLDLGADPKALQKALDSLPLEGFRTEIAREKKAGIDCCDFRVILDKMHENHDHDMAYLHGMAEETAQEHSHHDHGEHDHHGHDHGEHDHHGHDHGEHDHHSHEHEGHDHSHAHSHEHRSLSDVREILAKADLTPGAHAYAERIFSVLAEAEAEAHGTTIEDVHFHEVGAVDSIVDITAAAVCLDDLQIKEVIVPYLCEGQGTVRTQHGILPVPVPAVVSIAAQYGLQLRTLPAKGEFVTPTGAAICAAIRTRDELPEKWTIRKIGCGAGKREYSIPSLFRAMLISADEGSSGRKDALALCGENDKAPASDTIWKLESNIDDCSGEVLGYVSGLLLEAGARDVHYTPAFMKKNRPGWQINILCDEERREALEQILFRETTTIGIRRVRMERTILRREASTVQTSSGDVQVKICDTGMEKKVYPEYDSVAALAKSSGRPFLEIYAEAENGAVSKNPY